MNNHTTKERGQFKENIHSALYQSREIKELLLGDISGLSNNEIRNQFRKCVKSHLFIDDTIEEVGSYIFYDVYVPKLHTTTKRCDVILYAMCHREILDDYYKDGYYGNRSDILSQMIENALLNNEEVRRKFGIGDLLLDSVNIYNSTKILWNNHGI